MEDSHVLHTIVKIERENTPSKMGKNNVWAMLPILHGEVVYRNIEQKLIEYRIRDAMKHGDTRRLVIATADKENSNGRTTDAQAKNNVP